MIVVIYTVRKIHAFADRKDAQLQATYSRGPTLTYLTNPDPLFSMGKKLLSLKVASPRNLWFGDTVRQKCPKVGHGSRYGFGCD